jgi:hypothetical protein
MRLQCYAGPVDHSQDTTTVQGDLTGRRHTADYVQRGRMMGLDVPHVVEGIICYSKPLMSYCKGFYLPQDHLSGLESQCNCLAFSYKRTGHAPILDRLKQPQLRKRLFWASSTLDLNNTQQYNNPLHGHRVLRSGSPNHVNHRVHPACTSRALVPPINEPLRTTLVVVSGEVL